MLSHLKKYPFSLCVVVVIFYLSFFTPPQTDMDPIPGIDKLAHLCMYDGLCTLIWIEYLRSHRTLQTVKIWVWGIIAPILLSGAIELLQAYCTDHRGGEWMDFAANSTGVILATLIGYYLLRPWLWRKK